MCLVPGAPKLPPLPAPPPPIPPPPTPQDPAVSAARQRTKQQAALAQGRNSTVLTGGLGLTSPATSAKKTILGS